MSDLKPSQRYHDLDALRAFAMLLGLLLHGAMSLVVLPVTVNATQDVCQGWPVYGWLMDAIHGFRMPLFFLVSGMFTALLWKRRGLRSLIRHRLVRVGIPLLIGVLTIVPAVITVNILWSRNIWTASAKGDVAYVQSWIDVGRDINAPFALPGQPGDGGSPLHLAAASKQHAIAELLLGAGADVNVQALDMTDGQPSLATPLHWAVFMADKEMVELLIENRADVNAMDAAGTTPLDYSAGNPDRTIAEVLTAAGGQHGADLPVAVKLDPMSSASGAVDSTSGNTDKETDYLGVWISEAPVPMQLFALLCYFPVFAHLWFLWYLLWMVALFVVAAGGIEKFRIRAMPAWIFRFPTLMLWALPITFLLQLPMVQAFGPDTATGIVPWPPTFVYYAFFFGVGCMYWCRPQADVQLGSRYVLCLVLAGLVLPVGVYAIGHRHVNFMAYHGLASFISAAYVWLMILGLFGLFRYMFSNENGRVRYISDASYWIYLVHLPIVYLLQILVADWLVPSQVKFAIICGGAFGVSLLSYAAVVRYTWIGAMLHGRKYR